MVLFCCCLSHHLSSCSLLNSSGGILAYAGYATEVDPRVMAAITNNITYLFERTTQWTFDGENVDMIIVACSVSEQFCSAFGDFRNAVMNIVFMLFDKSFKMCFLNV